MRPMQILRGAKEIPWNKPQIPERDSDDASPAVRKFGLHFTLQDKRGNASSLEQYCQQEVHNTYPYGTMDILRCFKWSTLDCVVDQAEKDWKAT